MPIIVETKKYTRPSTDATFFDLSDNPVLRQAKDSLGSFTDVERTDNYIKKTNSDGSIIVERMISDDGLIQTITNTFSSLEVYSQYDTTFGINVDHSLRVYSADDKTVIGQRQYTQAGLTQPFTCTTTYTYNDQTSTNYPQFESFINLLESSDKLISLTNTGTQIIAVHKYQDSADFTENHWADFDYTNGLHAGGVTRTISYALV